MNGPRISRMDSGNKPISKIEQARRDYAASHKQAVANSRKRHVQKNSAALLSLIKPSPNVATSILLAKPPAENQSAQLASSSKFLLSSIPNTKTLIKLNHNTKNQVVENYPLAKTEMQGKGQQSSSIFDHLENILNDSLHLRYSPLAFTSFVDKPKNRFMADVLSGGYSALSLTGCASNPETFTLADEERAEEERVKKFPAGPVQAPVSVTLNENNESIWNEGKKFFNYEEAVLNAGAKIMAFISQSKAIKEYGFKMPLCKNGSKDCTLPSEIIEGKKYSVGSEGSNDNLGGHSHPLIEKDDSFSEEDKKIDFISTMIMSPSDEVGLRTSSSIDGYKRHALINPNNLTIKIFYLKDDAPIPKCTPIEKNIASNGPEYEKAFDDRVNNEYECRDNSKNMNDELRQSGRLVVQTYKITNNTAELCNLRCAEENGFHQYDFLSDISETRMRNDNRYFSFSKDYTDAYYEYKNDLLGK